MFRKVWQRAKRRDGFTLIELIVVVAILGILAAVLTPRVLDAIDNAKASSAEAVGKQIQLAMERYYLDNKGYPTIGEMKAKAGDPAQLEYADLEAMLSKYLTIAASQFEGTFEYEGTKSDGQPAGDNDTLVTYTMTVTHKDSGKTLEITPALVDVN